jgi:hypothetical protein
LTRARAPRFQQVHGSGGFVSDSEAAFLEQHPPRRCCQQPDPHVNIQRHASFHLAQNIRWYAVRNGAELVNTVAASRAQQTKRFLHDAALLLRPLHGKHRFAVHYRRACVRQAGVLGRPGNAFSRRSG